MAGLLIILLLALLAGHAKCQETCPEGASNITTCCSCPNQPTTLLCPVTCPPGYHVVHSPTILCQVVNTRQWDTTRLPQTVTINYDKNLTLPTRIVTTTAVWLQPASPSNGSSSIVYPVVKCIPCQELCNNCTDGGADSCSQQCREFLLSTGLNYNCTNDKSRPDTLADGSDTSLIAPVVVAVTAACVTLLVAVVLILGRVRTIRRLKAKGHRSSPGPDLAFPDDAETVFRSIDPSSLVSIPCRTSQDGDVNHVGYITPKFKTDEDGMLPPPNPCSFRTIHSNDYITPVLSLDDECTKPRICEQKALRSSAHQNSPAGETGVSMTGWTSATKETRKSGTAPFPDREVPMPDVDKEKAGTNRKYEPWPLVKRPQSHKELQETTTSLGRGNNDEHRWETHRKSKTSLPVLFPLDSASICSADTSPGSSAAAEHHGPQLSSTRPAMESCLTESSEQQSDSQTSELQTSHPKCSETFGGTEEESSDISHSQTNTAHSSSRARFERGPASFDSGIGPSRTSSPRSHQTDLRERHDVLGSENVDAVCCRLSVELNENATGPNSVPHSPHSLVSPPLSDQSLETKGNSMEHCYLSSADFPSHAGDQSGGYIRARRVGGEAAGDFYTDRSSFEAASQTQAVYYCGPTSESGSLTASYRSDSSCPFPGYGYDEYSLYTHLPDHNDSFILLGGPIQSRKEGDFDEVYSNDEQFSLAVANTSSEMYWTEYTRSNPDSINPSHDDTYYFPAGELGRGDGYKNVSPPPNPVHPVLSPAWQLWRPSLSSGGVLQGDNSDVRLVLPSGFIAPNKTVLIQTAVCTDLDKAHRVLQLAEEECIVSPVVEYFAGADLQFNRPVQILLPHFLPPGFDPQFVNVYCFQHGQDASAALRPRLHKLHRLNDTQAADIYLQRSASDSPEVLRGSVQSVVEINTGTFTSPHGYTLYDDLTELKEPAQFDAGGYYNVTTGMKTSLSLTGTSQSTIDLEGNHVGSFEFGENSTIVISTSHFSGYLCTYCGESFTPPFLHVQLYASHMEKEEGGRRVDVRSEIWDQRLQIKDFSQRAKEEAEECGLQPVGDRKCLRALRDRDLGDRDDLEDVLVGTRFDLSKKDRDTWEHLRDPDSEDLVSPVERTVEITEFVPCKCRPQIPYQVEWHLNNKDGVTPHDVIEFWVTTGYIEPSAAESFRFMKRPEPVVIIPRVRKYEERTAEESVGETRGASNPRLCGLHSLDSGIASVLSLASSVSGQRQQQVPGQTGIQSDGASIGSGSLPNAPENPPVPCVPPQTAPALPARGSSANIVQVNIIEPKITTTTTTHTTSQVSNIDQIKGMANFTTGGDNRRECRCEHDPGRCIEGAVNATAAESGDGLPDFAHRGSIALKGSGGQFPESKLLPQDGQFRQDRYFPQGGHLPQDGRFHRKPSECQCPESSGQCCTNSDVIDTNLNNLSGKSTSAISSSEDAVAGLGFPERPFTGPDTQQGVHTLQQYGIQSPPAWQQQPDNGRDNRRGTQPIQRLPNSDSTRERCKQEEPVYMEIDDLSLSDSVRKAGPKKETRHENLEDLEQGRLHHGLDDTTINVLEEEKALRDSHSMEFADHTFCQPREILPGVNARHVQEHIANVQDKAALHRLTDPQRNLGLRKMVYQRKKTKRRFICEADDLVLVYCLKPRKEREVLHWFVKQESCHMLTEDCRYLDELQTWNTVEESKKEREREWAMSALRDLAQQIRLHLQRRPHDH